jgi:hypothetical protein
MVWVREQTIPTKRPPLVGEVIANFCGYRVPRGQRDGSLRPYSRLYRQEPLLSYQVAPQLYSQGRVDPFPEPLLFSGSAGNRTRASRSVLINLNISNKSKRLNKHSDIFINNTKKYNIIRCRAFWQNSRISSSVKLDYIMYLFSVCPLT